MSKYPKPRKPNGRLTPKQAAFCIEFLKDLNASAAARRAGYSAKSAGRQCIDLLRKPHIAARVQQLQAERTERTQVDADWVMRRLTEELEAKASDLFDDDGALKPVKDWPDVWQKGLVTSIRTTEMFETDASGKRRVVGYIKDVTFADRVKRIELLGRHINVHAFKEKVSLRVEDPLKTLFEQISGSVDPAGGRADQDDRAPAAPQAPAAAGTRRAGK